MDAGERMNSSDQSEWRSAWQAIIRPVLAYCAASYAAAVALLVLGPFGNVTTYDLAALALLPVSGLFLATIVATLAFIPTVLIAAFMFLTSIPRGIGEACAGAAIGPFLIWFIYDFRATMWVASAVVPVAIAGAIAGAVYWLLVGRPKNPRAAPADPP